MRKQLVFIILILGSGTISDIQATLELSALLSLTAANYIATSFLCCMRCKDKSEQRARLEKLEADCSRTSKCQDHLQTLALARILDPDNKRHDQRPRPVFDGPKNTVSQATNTDLVLMTPPLNTMQPRRSLDKKSTQTPSDCQ